MKNLVIFIAVLFGFIGCVATKVVTEKPKPQQTESVDKPIVWKQSYFKTISLRDSVLFYNSTEIKLEGDFFNQSFSVKDGAVLVVDSINKVSKIVPILTPGGLVDMRKNSSGEINIMVVSFSKNEATYKFSFFRMNDGSFGLNGKAELIFKNHRYPVTAVTIGDCVLLFNYKKEQVIQKIEETAPGWKQDN